MRNTAGRLSRRSLARAGLGGLALLVPLIAACGGAAPPTTAPAAAPKPTTAPAAAPGANAPESPAPTAAAQAGSPTPAAQGAATAPAAAKPQAGAAGKVTIRFLHGREDVTGAAVKSIVERFNAENPGIEVKTEVIGSQAAQIQ